MLPIFLVLAALVGVRAVAPVQGTQCAPNQVINRLTVYENGGLEAECGPIPCGQSGAVCKEDASCRAEADVASGMRWAANGKSLLLRCCSMKSSNKIYVGTDVVTYGSYYQGGEVSEKELYGKEGLKEYDFIANVRAEQGGVRVWVYRIMCAAGEIVEPFEVKTTAAPTTVKTTTTEETEAEEETDSEEAEEPETAEQQDEAPTTVDEKPFNPLRYRPPQLQRSSTGVRRH